MPSTIASPQADLLRLVCRVARKDNAAFVALYDLLAATLLNDLRSTMTDLAVAEADAITAATFIEVWSLARYHTGSDTDVYAWMTNIAARRAADRWSSQREGQPPAHGVDKTGGPANPRRAMWSSAVAASYDRQAQVSLASLLHREVPQR